MGKENASGSRRRLQSEERVPFAARQGERTGDVTRTTVSNWHTTHLMAAPNYWGYVRISIACTIKYKLLLPLKKRPFSQ